jgi:electron transfer flavoprotein alpha subunit
MTADCTALEMDANTDLIQIRPAFGGNIMAKIKTSMNRPQICTARYKVFDKISPSDKNVGEIIPMTFTNANKTTATSIIKLITKAKEQDISDADIVVVAGRGFKKKEDLILAQNLADALGAQLGCSRPLVENG